MIRKALCLVVFVFLVACGTEEDIDIQEVQATVIEGDQNQSNCQWLININNQTYVPNYLPTDFQEDNLTVLLKVEFLSTLQSCGNTSFERLRIEQIRLED